jgi:hypothetical protein
MIINELSYLEEVDADVVGGFKSIFFDKQFYVNQNISGSVNLKPGTYQAVVSGDSVAAGGATLTEVDFLTTAGKGMSQSSVVSIAAAQGY